MSLNVTGGNLEFVATLDTTQLENKAKGIEETFAKVSKNAENGAAKSQSLFSSIAAGIISVNEAEKAFDFLGDSINEALDAEQSTARFRNTLESINRADAFDRLMDAADRLAKKFTYLDNDDVVAVFNKLVTYGKLTEKQMNDLLPVIINFSAKQRISIEQGSSIIIKALEGNTRSLKEYGINMKSTASETERLNVIMTQLKGKVDGAGEAFQNTVTGGVASARQEFKNLQEDIGTSLLPLLNKTLSFINKAIKGLKGITQSQEEQQNTEDSQVRAVVSTKLVKVQQQIDAKIVNPKTGKPVTAEDYIKAFQEAMPKQDEFNKRVFQGLIVELSKDKFGLNGVEQETKKVVKANSELNSLLNERKSLLESIKDIQRDSARTGLTEEQKQLNLVAEKYDNLISKIDEYNKKAVKLGRPTISTEEVKTAKQVAIDNTQLRQQAADYKSFLENQSKLFDQFEEAKKNFGIAKAREMLAGQTKDFANYRQFLQSEALKIAPNIITNTANIGQVLKFKSLLQALSEDAKKSEEDLLKERVENFKRLLESTTSFNQQRLAYEKQYEEDVAELKKAFTGQELEDRLKVLKQAKDADLKALSENLSAHTKGWRTLNQSIVNFTRERIRQEITTLENLLKNSTLDEKTKQAIKEAIEDWKKLDKNISDTKTTMDKIVEAGSVVRDTFGKLGSAVSPLNKQLGDALNSMSQLAGSVVDVTKSFDALKAANKTGDIVGQIAAATDIVTAIIQGISILVNGVKKALDDIKKAQQAVTDFDSQLITGEQEYQALLRQRARTQVTLNKLTIDAIDAQKKLLEAQKQTAKQSADDLLKQIQGLTYVVDIQTKKKGLFSRNLVELFGKPDQIKEITDSLAGKTFDELEELFTKGQLSGKAKELFEQLQKLRQEGADIDQQLADLKEKAAEAFTGTTASNIADTIAQGFADGKSSIADFAGDFESLMRQAIINSLKLKYLEGPVKDLFDQFANDTQSGGQLTKTEIEDLRNKYNAIIANASQQFEQLQQIAGVNFASTSTSQQNTLVGGFKSMTEDTGNLLAGQFGAVRIAQLQLVDLQKISNNHLYAIETNTFNTWSEIMALRKDITNFYRVEGIKLK